MIIQKTLPQNLGLNNNTEDVAKVTVMLLSITVTFIVLLAPLFIIVQIKQFTASHVFITLYLLYLNMSLKFYLCRLSGKMFRDEALKCFGRCVRCKIPTVNNVRQDLNPKQTGEEAIMSNSDDKSTL